MAKKNQRESKKNQPKLSIKERKAQKKAKKAAGSGSPIAVPKPKQ